MKIFKVWVGHAFFGSLIDQPIRAASAAEAAAEGILLAFSGAGTFEGPAQFDTPINLAEIIVRVRLPENGQSGETISPGPAWTPHVPAAVEAEKPPTPPLPDRTGGFPHVRMCVEGNAWFCNGDQKFGCSAAGCKGPDPLPDRTGGICGGFGRCFVPGCPHHGTPDL